MQFLFEGFVLDLGRRELTRGAEPIAVAPQVFDLLVYLVQNRERVVSKDELLDAIWAGRIVSESTLASHINAVRKAVGDCGAECRLPDAGALYDRVQTLCRHHTAPLARGAAPRPR